MFSIVLHPATLAITNAFINIASVAMMVIVWRTTPGTRGPGCWMVASVVCMTAYSSGMLGIFNTNIWNAAVNISTMTLFSLYFEGILRFKGIGSIRGRLPWWVAFFVVVVAVSILTAPYPPYRYMFSDSYYLVLLLSGSLILLYRQDRATRAAETLCAAVLFCLAIGFAMRWNYALRYLLGYTEQGAQAVNEPLFFTFTIWTLLWMTGAAALVLYRKQGELEALTRLDPLTGLANRRQMDALLEESLLALERNGERFGLVLFDLDRFKQVNDVNGHAVGDALLVEIGQRLRRVCRDGEHPARLGGDEFVILLSEVDTRDRLDRFIERLRLSVSGSAVLDGKPIQIEMSIGGALAPEDGANQTDLLHVVDARMYEDKRRRRSQWQQLDWSAPLLRP